MKEKIFGIDTDNPWEYYGTDNINDIPKHLRDKALKMKYIILTICLSLLLIGCGKPTISINETNYTKEYNLILTQYNELKGDYHQAGKDLLAAQSKTCPKCNICNDTEPIKENCLPFIHTIQRLENQKVELLLLNDTQYCDSLKFNLSKCERKLNKSEEKLIDIKGALE